MKATAAITATTHHVTAKQLQQREQLALDRRLLSSPLA